MRDGNRRTLESEICRLFLWSLSKTLKFCLVDLSQEGRVRGKVLPGYDSHLPSRILLNKLPLHNKLPINYWIESVSPPCQRTRIMSEWGFTKIAREGSGMGHDCF